jgi:hypothetical protein
MGDIKIVRLQSGEDIIAEITEVDGTGEIILDDPMVIFFKRIPSGKTMMVMTPWLPVELIEDNRATLFAGDIVTVLEPRNTMKEYYINLVGEYSEEIEDSISKFDSSMMEILEDDENIDMEEEDYLVPDKQLLH